MTIALKEIHISNEKKRDANVRFVSLIKENDPKLAYKGKSIKNSRLLISSDKTSEESLIKQYKSKLAENILNSDVDINIEYAGKFIGDTDRILFNSKNEILYSPPKIKEVLFNKDGKEVKKQDPKEIVPNVRDDTPPLKWTGKFFKREESKKYSFKDKKKKFGFTNNPKYFDKKSSTDNTIDSNNKKFKFKKKKRFKNRKRTKNFSFNRFKKKR